MSLSEEEKEALRKEDFRRKARGLRLRLMDNPTASDDILPALQLESEEDRKLLESFLWEELVREMPADAHVFQHLDLLEKMLQAEKSKAILREAREAFKNATKTRGKDRKKILLREKKKLASWGISGSAVVPKLPPDSEAGAELARMIGEYKDRLLEQAASSS
jgi:hypothetical protein